MHTHLQTLMYEHMCIPPTLMKTHTHVCGRISVCAVSLYVRISVSECLYLCYIYVCMHIYTYLYVLTDDNMQGKQSQKTDINISQRGGVFTQGSPNFCQRINLFVYFLCSSLAHPTLRPDVARICSSKAHLSVSPFGKARARN